MSVNIQFKKGVLELCVLVLIGRRDRYGYELVQAVSRHVEVAEGALYPLLRRLVSEGFCTTYLQESTEGPPRKYYRLTDTGRKYMHELKQDWNDFVRNVGNLLEERDFDE
ncbi:PadR family transcriptional regulator [Paenibacillus sp. P96]|uniref:PadR family transcriptional regulator n=1 Tax=Paenibacillus zeirhizosphaerae TaxID=2987519 RepID=A0ABT9FN71_9BACL|nr:PadR family transcriptional regulator [Paenibacillus sp. P96]MDP4096182.1 PadR family transcriptional regulator [Paenibacillus sp. P96]